MSFLKKTLASFGIGSARVDSILQQEYLKPGEKANLTIEVYGGSTEQAIDNIDLKLCCRYFGEETVERSDDSRKTRRVAKTHILNEWKLPYAFTIEPGQQRDFEVELDIPWNAPVTIADTKVWLETGLDISMAVDPSDKDIITVRPDPLMDGIFSELEEQGLRIRQVECEETKGFALPFVQEFEFVPTTGPYHGRWRELEIVAHRNEKELELWFEIDRQQKGVGGMMASLLGTGKLKRSLTIPADTPSEEAGKMVLEYLESSS
ncbi:sporulation protein [Vibrio sp. JC009]|uniref:sporulation protein n=1 Tax=Vibrio sp. JC009 TaxID=2912314 RepID=UPI0023AFB7FC|nr:sporulation protein [Vibrio sp. JC009]WED21815.1 sporulation protein [Vibrio sp. JC009]